MFLAGMKFAPGMVTGLFMAASVILGVVGILEWALDLRRKRHPDSSQQREPTTHLESALNRQPFMVSYPRTTSIPSEAAPRGTECL
jgi:hypothetical protein